MHMWVNLDARVQMRLGFGVDIVGYSSRLVPERDEIQQRLARLVSQVLDGLGIDLEQTDWQGTGDGLFVFLPLEVEVPKALAALMGGWQERIHADNRRYRDRMRLRAAAAIGLFGPGDLGFHGETIVEVSRLLDSAALRNAVTENPDSDLEFIISDRLYRDVVEPGYQLMRSFRFEQRAVRYKTYDKIGWLWIK
ncbi:hypothetical protein [Nocardia crassostreae]|uniref:hypothetical protein n=1 Tax=Nocardia crassostreae TaxID=53428 RepID=UPI00082FA858|nr:hypothetical protein [Nocardia crassostreae]